MLVLVKNFLLYFLVIVLNKR